MVSRKGLMHSQSNGGAIHRSGPLTRVGETFRTGQWCGVLENPWNEAPEDAYV